MAVVKMMVAFLGMVAVAYALPPQEEALLAEPAGQNQKEGGNIRERREVSGLLGCFSGNGYIDPAKRTNIAPYSKWLADNQTDCMDTCAASPVSSKYYSYHGSGTIARNCKCARSDHQAKNVALHVRPAGIAGTKLCGQTTNDWCTYANCPIGPECIPRDGYLSSSSLKHPQIVVDSQQDCLETCKTAPYNSIFYSYNDGPNGKNCRCAKGTFEGTAAANMEKLISQHNYVYNRPCTFEKGKWCTFAMCEPSYTLVGKGLCVDPTGIRVYGGSVYDDNDGTEEQKLARCASGCFNQIDALYYGPWYSQGPALGFGMKPDGRCYCNHVKHSTCAKDHESYDAYEFSTPLPYIPVLPSNPTANPSAVPTGIPSLTPSLKPTANPSTMPSAMPSAIPTALPTTAPTQSPSTGIDGLHARFDALEAKIDDLLKHRDQAPSCFARRQQV